jgi:hypothetical protein
MNKRWVALAAPATLTSAPLFALSELRDQWGKIRDAHAAWRSWQRPPWVGVFAPPKSASTFVWAVLARLLNADRTVFNTVHPRDGGLQLTHELDSKRMQDRRLQRRSVVFRMHLQASQHTLFHIRELAIRTIVCSRDVFDCLVSLREEWLKQWTHREQVEGTRERGTEEAFLGTIPIPIIERFMSVEPERQIDMVIELATLWYLRFYQSWRCVLERDPGAVCVCRFDELAGASEQVIERVLAFLDYPASGIAISDAISAVMQDRAEANLNVGVAGRGRRMMSAAQIDRVIAIARTMKAEDLLGGL